MAGFQRRAEKAAVKAAAAEQAQRGEKARLGFEEGPTEKTDQPSNAAAKQSLTGIQFGLSKKQIVVPSFVTTAKVFGEHFVILRELKHRIDLLRQAYYGQMDRRKTWEQVDEIIKVLGVGCAYLDFPVDKDVEKYMVVDEDGVGALRKLTEGGVGVDRGSPLAPR